MKVLQQSKKGCEQSLCKLSFLSDELVFHPQKAEDCGWRMFAANDKYMVIYIYICRFNDTVFYIINTD